MANLLFLNGVDVESTLSHSILAMPNWRGGYETGRASIPIPDAPFAVEGPEVTQSRPLRLTLLVGGPTSTAAQRADMVDALVSLVRSGRVLVPIRIGDQSDRQLMARYETHEVAAISPAAEMMVGIPWSVTLRFTAPDPRWIATTATTISSIGTTPKSVTAGSAEHDWTYTQTGGTSPVITVRDKDGNTVGQMTLNGDFTGETVTIKGGKTQSIATTKNLSGASPYSLLSAWKTEQWIRFQPEWWVNSPADWMDIAVSSGSGQLVYYPAYRS